MFKLTGLVQHQAERIQSP